MSEYYTHLLITKPKSFVPTAIQVQQFLATMVVRQAIPNPVTVTLFTPSDRTRSGINPFTGEVTEIKIKDRLALRSIEAVSAAVSGLADYGLDVSGDGRPALPPLPLAFDEPYNVSIRCRTSSVARSTSYINDWIDKSMSVPFIGTPCSGNCTLGLFSDPNQGPVIEVPDGGCARFWIEFELGKNLFPIIKDRDLRILNQEIVSAAERLFAVSFVQGYNWG